MKEDDKDKIIGIAESIGWSVYVCNRGKEFLEFSKTTPRGRDFSVCIESASTGGLIHQLTEYISDYDVDYESYLWIDGDGHGKNGAPYHIKDIVADQEAALGMVKDLYKHLKSRLLW